MAIAAIAVATHVVTAAEAAAASLLRDPDIEHGLSELAAPVLRAAGLNPKRVRVLVVNDSSLNAFVVDGQTVFVHYGLILKVQSAAMLQAVIAHEAAHISNGHIARRMGNLRSARTAAGLGAALAVIAAAGRSAAHYMTSTGLDPQGLVDLHRAFAGQEALSVGRQNPYMQSHPLTRDRTRIAESFVAAQPADAYYYELKGQILLENRKMQAALDAYETAVALAPRESLIQGSYGQALLAADQPKAALVPLEEARSRDFRDALEGRMEDAARQAQRATTLLPRGSAPWQRAQDVVIASEHAKKRKKR